MLATGLLLIFSKKEVKLLFFSSSKNLSYSHSLDGYIERFKLSLGAGEWENWLRNPDLLRIQEGPNPVINKQIEVKNAKLGIEQVKDIIIT